MRFEEKLIKLRKEKTLSQEELGEKLNVTRQTISKWELGQSKPDMDTLKEMSSFFGVSMEQLINDDIDINSKPKGSSNKTLITILIVVIVVLALLGGIIKLVAFFHYKKIEEATDGLISGAFSGATSIMKDVYNDIQEDKQETDSKHNQVYDNAQNIISEIQNNINFDFNF